MIDLYYWGTPNGQKIAIFLEEAKLDYKVNPINIGKGDQTRPDFLAHSPNGKIPAIVDHSPADAGGPISVFESGAILWYLAEKTGKFIPDNQRGKVEVSQWLFWQMAGLGPMSGQNNHFRNYAPEKIPYAIDRYSRETLRLYKVLDQRLADRAYVAGEEYSIADMAIYPWIAAHKVQQINIDDFPNLKRWFDVIAERPAVKKAYELSKSISPPTGPLTDEARKHLFGHDPHVSKDASTQGSQITRH